MSKTLLSDKELEAIRKKLTYDLERIMSTMRRHGLNLIFTVPKLYEESLALKHSIQLEKIERKLEEAEKKLEIVKSWYNDLEYRLKCLEEAQRKEK